MIPLPNLDDQSYADIVEAAKRRIPIIAPEWTDLNEHDPGITLIELFAWLKEMQQYYLNRIPERSYVNMLRLLGMELLPPAPARTAAVFPGKRKPPFLPRGTRAFGKDGTEFLLTEEYTDLGFSLGKIYTQTENGFTDLTAPSEHSETPFYPFGNAGTYGKLLINCQTDPDRFGGTIRLTFVIPKESYRAENGFGESTYLPREILWEYSLGSGFSPCKLLSDETRALSVSGKLTLRVGGDFSETDNAPFRGLWLRARLRRVGCEGMPAVKGVYGDTLSLTQKRTECLCEEFTDCGEEITVKNGILPRGLCFVMIRDPYGWTFSDNAEVSIQGSEARIRLTERGSLAADGAPNLRVILCTASFAENQMRFSADGLPDLRLPLEGEGVPVFGDLRIVVGDRTDEEFPRWHEYRYIDALGRAGAFDRRFTYDETEKTIVFGDNEHGEAPPRGENNLWIISCSFTKGAGGNLPAGSLPEIGGFPLKQPEPCVGGRDREKLSEAMARLRERSRRPTRAVTAEDYRTLALQTPGIRIADAKAILGFDADSPDSPPEKQRNTVTLVVIPRAETRFPTPDAHFLAEVGKYMENFRLVTVNLKITAPVYIKTDINADIVCDTDMTEAAAKKAESVLTEWFSPKRDGRFRFGELIGETEVLERIASVEGVTAVRHIGIAISGQPAVRDRIGRVVFPPHAVAYSGKIRLNAVRGG